MKQCTHCNLEYPDNANYCVNCGRPLSRVPEGAREERRVGGNWNIFLLTLGGSLLLSWVLIAVFNLPIFILGALLPLFWLGGKR